MPKDLNVVVKPIKVLEENMGENSSALEFDQDLLNRKKNYLIKRK